MAITILRDNKSINVFELQGEIENIDLFNGKFNEDTIELEFDTFILKGTLLNKQYTIIEKDNDKVKIISQDVKYYLFDKPPRHKI